jgi:putative oxidoreductase
MTAGSLPAPRPALDVRLAPWAALMLRLALGVVFLAHGWFKVAVLGLPGTSAFFEGFGFPGWSAYPVAALELLGGLALIAGWAVRPVALVLAGVVLGAFRVHWANGWYFGNPDGGWEYLAVLLVGLLALALLGPGAGSLQRRLSAPRGSPHAARPDSACPA